MNKIHTLAEFSTISALRKGITPMDIAELGVITVGAVGSGLFLRKVLQERREKRNAEKRGKKFVPAHYRGNTLIQSHTRDK